MDKDLQKKHIDKKGNTAQIKKENLLRFIDSRKQKQ